MVLVTTAIGLDVMAEDYTSRLTLDSTAKASEPYSFQEAKDLNFHSVKIDKFYVVQGKAGTVRMG